MAWGIRPGLVVLLAPGFDQELRFRSCCEHVYAEVIITEQAIEWFLASVFPRGPRSGVGRTDGDTGIAPVP